MPSGKNHIFEYEDAVIVFAIPANRNISRFLFDQNISGVWELARLWAPDGHRPNLLTQAIAYAIAELKKIEPKAIAIVAYADPNVRHHGGIYRAASWLYTGQSEEGRYYVSSDGRTIARRAFHAGKKFLRKKEIENLGYHEIQAEGKHRFVRGLTSWARKRLIRKFMLQCQRE